MPKLVREIASVLDLEDALLNGGSGGACEPLGDSNLDYGLVPAPEVTPARVVTALMSRINIQENIKNRMHKSLSDSELLSDDMMVLAKVFSSSKLGSSVAPGLSVAMWEKLEELTLRPGNTPRDLLYLEKAQEFLLEAELPGICPTEASSSAFIGTHTFEDYGEMVLENL